MNINRNQKVLTLLFCVLLIVVLFNFTPAWEWGYNGQTHFYGNFFAIDPSHIYYKFFIIEIAFLALLYLLIMLVLNNQKRSN